MKKPNESFSDIPEWLMSKWQKIADLLAEIVHVPAALITKLEKEGKEIIVASNSENNPYPSGQVEPLHGMYCETVVNTNSMLSVQDALVDAKWSNNPDLALGMVAYLGFPVHYPDGQIFGTICILDNRENSFSSTYMQLILQFRELIENDLFKLQDNDSRTNKPEGEKSIKEDTDDLLSEKAIELKRIEDLFLQKTALFETVLNTTKDGVLVIDRDGKKVFQNQRTVDLFKIPIELASNVDDQFQLQYVIGTTKDPEQFAQKVFYLYDHPEESSQDEIELKDGTILFRYSAPVLGKDGCFYGRIWLFRDITERRKAENELKMATADVEESNKKYRKLIENIRVGIVVHAPDTSIILSNPKASLILGLSPQQMEGKNIMDPNWYFLDETGRRLSPEEYPVAKVISSGKEIDKQTYGINRPENGDRFWVELSAYPEFDINGQIKQVLVSFINVNDRRKAEIELLENQKKLKSQNEELEKAKEKAEKSETRFKSLFNNMGNSASLYEAVFDGNGEPYDYRFLEINKKYEENLGLKASDLEGRTLLELFPTTETEWLETFKEVVKKGLPSLIESYSIEVDRYFEIIAYRPQNGQLALIGSDITQRKRNEQEIIKSNEKAQENRANLQAIIENTSNNIWAINSDYELTYINQLFRDEFYTSFGEKLEIGKNVISVLPEHLRNIWKERYDRALNNEQFTLEDKVEIATDQFVHIQVSMNPIVSNEKIIGVSIFASNITERKLTEEKLRINEERLRMALEASTDAIWEWDISNNETYFSPRWYEIFGYEPDQVKPNAKEWVALAHPDDRDAALKKIFQALADGKSYKVEFRTRHRDGHWIWSLVKGKVTSRGSDGKPVRISGTISDISLQKEFEQQLIESKKDLQSKNDEYQALNEEYLSINEELSQSNERLRKSLTEHEIAKEMVEESEEKHRFIFEHTTYGVVYHNDQGEITYANSAAERILGLDIDKLLGRNSTEQNWRSIHEDGSEFPGEDHPAMVSLRTGKPVYNVRMGLFSQKAKLPRWININAIPKFKRNENRPHEVFATFEDITEIKNATDELFSAKEKAEESDRLKTAFLQNMSHEIRTPMNAIMGFSDLLLKNFNNQTKLQHFTHIINQRCHDLLVIIDEILDISKIESGQLPVYIDKCNLNVLFDELTAFFTEQQAKLKKQHIKFGFHAPRDFPNLMISTDKVKLKQIFINLVGNAFKFTDQGMIDVGYKIDAPKDIIFSVSDSGIGIPADKQQLIFERFIQLEPDPNRIYGGTGLGLSIVKGLVGLLGGKIWLESELGIGSTFYFSLPYTFETYSNLEPVSSYVEETGNFWHDKTILVVEDDEYNTDYIKEILSETGISMVYTRFGSSAIKISASKSFDLVLMDIGLPDISGYEAIKIMKLEKPDLKIIAQTAYASSEDKQKALEAGCVDYISKPLKSETLLSMVNNHLSETPGHE